MKSTFPLALILMIAGVPIDGALADDASAAASAPVAKKCDVDESHRLAALTVNEQTAVTAVFKKFCASVGGEMVFGYDPRLARRLTPPEHPKGTDLVDYYPPDAIKREAEGTVLVMYVAEPDGRVSWAYLLRSSGDRELDIAGVLWLRNISFGTPASLDRMPVRLFMTMNVSFKLSPPTQRYQNDHSRP